MQSKLTSFFYISLFCLILLFTGSCSKKVNNALSKTTTISIEDEKELQQNLDKFIAAVNSSDWDVMGDLLYPKLFQFAPKETIEQAIREMADSGTKITSLGSNVQEIRNSVDHENERFVLVDYFAELTVELESEELQDDFVIEIMKSQFENIYGKKNVAYNPEDFKFSLKGDRSLFAIKDLITNNWYFLENKNDNPQMLEMLIPETVRKKMKL